MAIGKISFKKYLRKLVDTPALYSSLLFTLPSLSLYLGNVGKAALRDVYRPIFICFLVWTVLWLILTIIIRNSHKRGLLLATLALVSFSYSTYIHKLSDFYERLGTHQDVLMTVLAILAFAVSVYVVCRLLFSRKSFAAATPPLNLITLCALAIAAGNIAVQNIGGPRAVSLSMQLPAQLANIAPPEERPDIYHILLDAYGREDVLKEFYQHDNSEFINQLKARGFYVAENSSSNYYLTRTSISSMLNLQYHPDFDGGSFALKHGRILVKHSVVRRFLERQGYRFITFSSGYSVTEMHDAELYLSPRGVLTDFERTLGNTTPLRIFVSEILNQNARIGLTILERRILEFSVMKKARRKASYWYGGLRRTRIRFILENLRKGEFGEGPLYVFAHIMCPHGPNVFDENGDPPDVQGTIAASGLFPGFRKLYRGQIAYINDQILDVIDKIQARSPDAIILLHGDHGPRHFSGSSEWRDLVKCWTGILNACYLPGGQADLVFYDHVSPVNMYRLIFNKYFGTDLPRLKDGRFMPPPGELKELKLYMGKHIFVDEQF